MDPFIQNSAPFDSIQNGSSLYEGEHLNQDVFVIPDEKPRPKRISKSDFQDLFNFAENERDRKQLKKDYK